MTPLSTHSPVHRRKQSRPTRPPHLLQRSTSAAPSAIDALPPPPDSSGSPNVSPAPSGVLSCSCGGPLTSSAYCGFLALGLLPLRRLSFGCSPAFRRFAPALLQPPPLSSGCPLTESAESLADTSVRFLLPPYNTFHLLPPALPQRHLAALGSLRLDPAFCRPASLRSHLTGVLKVHFSFPRLSLRRPPTFPGFPPASSDLSLAPPGPAAALHRLSAGFLRMLPAFLRIHRLLAAMATVNVRGPMGPWTHGQ